MIRKTFFSAIIFSLIFLLLCRGNVFAQDDEITLYNYEDKTVAYIAIS